MADELKDAVFTEVLEVDVRSDKFKQGLDRLSKLYREWLSELGDDAKGLSDVTMFSDLSKQVKELSETTHTVLTEVMQGVNSLQQGMQSQISQTDKAIEGQAKKAKASADEQVKYSKEAVEQIKKNLEELNRYTDPNTGQKAVQPQLHPAQKFAQTLSAEQRAVFNEIDKEIAKTNEALEKSAKSRQDILNQELRAAEERYKEEVKAQTEADKRERARVKLIEDQAAIRQSALDREMKAAEERYQLEQKLTALAERRKKLAQDIEIEQEGLNNQADLGTIKAFQKEAKDFEASLKRARDIEIEQEGIVNRSSEERERSEQKRLGLVRQIEEAEERIARLNEDLGLSGGTDRRAALQEKKLLRERQYADAIEKVKRLEAEVNSSPAPSDEASAQRRLAATKDLEQATAQADRFKKQIRSAADEIQRMDEKNAGFSARFGRDLVGHIAGLARMLLIIQALVAMEQAFFAVVTAPFRVMKAGLDFLREMEERQQSLAVTIFANTRLSEDLAQNFQLAKTAAGEALEVLHQRAAATGLSLEDLQNTFKALIESGAGSLVTSLRDVITLTEQFQVLLTNMGSGPLATQISLDEVAKLFRGELSEGGNKFLTMLGISNKEWERMVSQAKTQKDLIAQLEPRLKKYTDAMKAGELGQQRLINQTKLLLNLLAGDAAETVFERLSKALEVLNKWLQANGSSISEYLKLFAEGILGIGEAIAKLGSAAQTFPILTGFLKTLAAGMVSITSVAKEAMTNISALFNLMFAGRDTSKIKKAIEEWKTAINENDRDTEAALNRILGTNQTPSEQFGSFGPKQSVLDKPANGVDAPDNRTNMALVQAQLANARKAIENDITAIQEKYDEMRQSVARALAANTISHADAVRELERVGQEEIAVLEEQRQAMLANVEAHRKLALEQAKDAAERATVAERFKGEVLDTQNRFDKLAAQVRKSISGARVAAADEMVAVLAELNRGRAELQAQEIQAAQNDVNAARQNGLLTEVQHFDALALIEDQAHERTAKRLLDEAGLYADFSSEKIKALNDVALEDQRYTDAVALRAQQRQRVLEEENRRRLQHEQDMRAMLLEERLIALEIGEIITPPTSLSAAQKTAFDARQREIDQLEREKVALLEVAAAKNKESEETRGLLRDLQALHLQRSQLLAQRLSEIDATVSGPNARRILLDSAVDDQRRGLSNRVNEASGRLQEFDRTFGGQEMWPELEAARDALVEALDSAAKELVEFNAAIEKETPSFKSRLKGVLDAIVGPGITEAWAEAESNVDKLAVVADGAAGALQTVVGLVDVFRQGARQGGVLGGTGNVIGALSQSKAITGLMSQIPVIGQFIPAIGGVLSLVGGLFTAAAKRIAEDVKKSFQNTLDQFRSGNATLVETVSELERQRQQAIIRLSGKKGGKEELNKLLPEFDREIAELRRTQQKIFDDFDTALNALNLQSDTLAQVNRQWQDINKQVKEYIGAGGEAAKASAFLQMNLEKLQKQAADELAQSEQDAIQEALKLNDILKQRQRLVDDFAQKEFDLINADSVERRQVGSVARGKELEQLRKQHSEQLAQMDEEIRLTTVRVDKQREIFDISKDIASLRRRDEELSLKALDAYIQKLRDLRSIASGAFFGPNSTALPASPNVNVEINVYGPANGEELADAFVGEYRRQMRLSPA